MVYVAFSYLNGIFEHLGHVVMGINGNEDVKLNLFSVIWGMLDTDYIDYHWAIFFG